MLVAGDVFVTTSYPVIRGDAGGGIDGFVAGLDKMLDIAVPKYLQEGGPYVIPGHGRIGDEADLLEFRDMAVILRDRIASFARRCTWRQAASLRPTIAPTAAKP